MHVPKQQTRPNELQPVVRTVSSAVAAERVGGGFAPTMVNAPLQSDRIRLAQDLFADNFVWAEMMADRVMVGFAKRATSDVITAGRPAVANRVTVV